VTSLRWDDVNRLPVEQKVRALALLLSPYTDPTTGRFGNMPPHRLLREIFPKDRVEGAAHHAVKTMRERGVLTNAQPKGGTVGEWTLHLPKDLRRCSDAVDAASEVEMLRVASDLVERFGAKRVPDLIAALRAIARQ